LRNRRVQGCYPGGERGDKRGGKWGKSGSKTEKIFWDDPLEGLGGKKSTGVQIKGKKKG